MNDVSDRLSAAWTRRLKLLPLLLQRESISTEQVARALSVDRRVALGDLKALAAHGVPLHDEGEGKARRWVLDESYRRLGYTVSFQDRIALLFGGELVRGFLRQTDLGESVSALNRTVSALDGETRFRDDELLRRFYVVHEPGKDYARHRKFLAALTNAIVGTQYVTVAYTKGRTGEVQRLQAATPLTLLLYKRGVYLVAMKQDQIRLIAVERMTELEVLTDQRFDYPRPSEYHPRTHFEGRFGITSGDAKPSPVILRFEPEVTTYVASRQWMPGQRLDTHGDGRCTLRFDATGRELVSFVLGFGDKVTVLGPEWLRNAVVDEMTRAISRYPS